MNIPSFVENNGIDTVLFCNYTMVPSNSKYMNALNAMIGALKIFNDKVPVL